MIRAGIFTAALALLGIGALPVRGADYDQGSVVAGSHAVLPWRDRPEVENRILSERIDTLLPALMVETGIDMWLVIAREYAEDPVYFTLVPQPAHAARRTTMLVFFRGPDGFEKLSVNRYPLGAPYQAGWSGGDLEQQWQGLADLIAAKNPRRIGINTSEVWPFADGLTHALHQRLMSVLPVELKERIVSAENLVVRWLETRTEGELALYPHIVGLARQVIGEAFSARVITPGATTTDDISWYIRERFAELQLPVWFHPDVNRQRAGRPCEKDKPVCGERGLVEPGDVLHTDVGICYLKLCTDTQEMAYVPRPGEQSVPGGLIKALSLGNRWQDGLTDAFQTGRDGKPL